MPKRGHGKLGRRLKRTLPGGQSESFAYNGAGSQLTHKDFNGRTTAFLYDAMNRLTNKTADPYFSSYWVRFNYTPFGSLSNVLDSTGRSVTNLYDVRNRLDKKISPEGVLKYTYDGNNNVLTVQSFSDIPCTTPHVGGIFLTYTRDSINRLKTITDNNASGAPITTYNYDELDRLKECVYPTTTVVKHTYAFNRLTKPTGSPQ